MVRERVRWPYVAFADRTDAGRQLAAFMGLEPDPEALVLGLPRGGIPVGAQLAKRFQAPLEPVIARKLPVPSSPEMGFGAVAIDGSRVLNRPLVAHLGLTDREIEEISERVRAEIVRRAIEYFSEARPPQVAERRIYMVDDGLATGYSMVAAAEMVRRGGPEAVVLAVPVAPESTLRIVEDYFDEIHCLIVQQGGPFGVASYYEDFHDMTDEEVRGVLSEMKTRRIHDKGS